MDDQTLIGLYWARDEDAIKETSTKYGKLCQYIANNILKTAEDCEECLNDTYFAVWNAIPVQRPNRFSVFISRITRNLALKKWEYLSAAKRNPSATISLDELGDCVSGRFIAMTPLGTMILPSSPSPHRNGDQARRAADRDPAGGETPMTRWSQPRFR